MARSTSKSAEELAAERMARLGISSVGGSRVAIPPSVAPIVAKVEKEQADESTATKKGKDQRLCIIVSHEQALKIKRYALEHETTVSDLLRGYIDSL